MIEQHLVPAKPLNTASDAEFLAALSAAIKDQQSDAPELARAARKARPQLDSQILRTSFRAVAGCDAQAKILFALRLDEPKRASQLFDEAVKLSPDCANDFAGKDHDGKTMMEGMDSKTEIQTGSFVPAETSTGNFGNPPGTNTGNFGNPPGANGQGGLVAVCHNGRTIFFLSPEEAARDLRRNPGDTLGACQVTPANNR